MKPFIKMFYLKKQQSSEAFLTKQSKSYLFLTSSTKMHSLYEHNKLMLFKIIKSVTLIYCTVH